MEATPSLSPSWLFDAAGGLHLLNVGNNILEPRWLGAIHLGITAVHPPPHRSAWRAEAMATFGRGFGYSQIAARVGPTVAFDGTPGLRFGLRGSLVTILGLEVLAHRTFDAASRVSVDITFSWDLGYPLWLFFRCFDRHGTACP